MYLSYETQEVIRDIAVAYKEYHNAILEKRWSSIASWGQMLLEAFDKINLSDGILGNRESIQAMVKFARERY